MLDTILTDRWLLLAIMLMASMAFLSLFVFLISKLIGWVKNLCGFGTKSNVEQIDDQKVIVETASVGMSEPNQEES